LYGFETLNPAQRAGPRVSRIWNAEPGARYATKQERGATRGLFIYLSFFRTMPAGQSAIFRDTAADLGYIDLGDFL
jgi:hypothetical protein